MNNKTSLQRELAELIVQSLSLEVEPDEISAKQPLFGNGLGLDSIDALELALEISQKYGVTLRSDDENNEQIFESLGTLAKYIDANRRS